MKSIMKKTIVILFVLTIILIVFTLRANAETKTSIANGNWNTATLWDPSGVPAIGDDVIIASTHSIIIDISTNSLNSLTINGTLTVGNDDTDRTLNISGDMLINSGGSFNTAGNGGNVLMLGGDLTNNEVFDANNGIALLDVVFNGITSQLINGTGSTMNFNFITINNSGLLNDNIVEVSSNSFNATNKFLTLISGILKISGNFTFNEQFFSANTYNVPSGSGIWLNNPNVTIAGQSSSPTLRGSMRVSNGTCNIGTNSGNSLKYYSGSSFTMEGGAVNIAGRFYPNSLTQTIDFSMSGGVMTIADIGFSSTSYAGFDIPAAGSSFSMNGGTIIIKNPNGTTGTQRDYRNQAGAVNITGGNVQFGMSTITGSPNYMVGPGTTNSVSPNILLAQATITTTVTLNSAIEIVGDITINNGTALDANGQGIVIAGDWNNTGGTYISGTNTTTFNGSADQALTGSDTYYNVVINKTTGNIILSNDNTISSTLIFHASNLGNIVTGANELILANDASNAIDRQGNGHIVGNLQWAIAAGANTYVYPLGSASAYTPLEIDFVTGTMAGSLTATTIDGDHPDLASSGIDGSASVNRYWSFIINSGLGIANYDATFNWVNADEDAGFDYSKANAGKLDGTTWIYPAMGALSSTSAQITGVSGFSDFQIGNYLTATISGNFNYFNDANTPLNAVQLELKQFGTTIQSTITDGSGYYEFTGIYPGDYDVVTTYSEQTGYINSTDAAQVNYWAVNPSTIEQAKFYAGDVTGDLSANSSDASLIQQHFLTLGNPSPTFATDWTFWTSGELISTNPGAGGYPTVTVKIGEISLSQDFFGLGTGDFNGSFVPGAKGIYSETLTLSYGDFIEIGLSEFELPLYAGMDMFVGAISIILNIPTDYLNVQDIYLENDPNKPLLYSVSGNEVRISWQSATAVSVPKDLPLLTLLLKLNQNPEAGEIKLSLNPNEMNELADNKYNVINNAHLVVDIIKTTTLGIVGQLSSDGIELNCFPNPFTEAVNFEYNIPVEGHVTLEIYDMVGSKERVIVDEFQTVGNHVFNADDLLLMPGIYMVSLKVDNMGDSFIRTIKIISK